MRKVLYLLSKRSDCPPADLIVSSSSGAYDVSIVLTQDTVGCPAIPGSRMYVLAGDDRGRPSSPFPTVSSRDLLRMTFEADTVIAL
jgi:hypothetical protein